MILGEGRHGKDTVCEILRHEYGIQFVSSSEFCAEHVVYPALFEDYSDWRECYDRRHERRDDWFRLIAEYNEKDPSRLAREIYEVADVYCGLRNRRELWAAQNSGVIDLTVWVDASDRVPPEPKTSCTVEPWMADRMLDNNGDIPYLKDRIAELFDPYLRTP